MTFMNLKRITQKLAQTDPTVLELKGAKKKDFDKMQKIKMKDRELLDNIEILNEWIKIYSPQEYFLKILDVDNEQFLLDFSYILQESQTEKDGLLSECQNQFIQKSLRLFMKGRVESKA